MKRHEDMIVRFYNRVSGASCDTILDVPDDLRVFLGNLNYYSLIEPFVVEDLKKGNNQIQCAIKYTTDRQVIRRIKKKYAI